jgi:HD-GYP domain-containing protein (c-di-GMP phosphodiesterase class II)
MMPNNLLQDSGDSLHDAALLEMLKQATSAMQPRIQPLQADEKPVDDLMYEVSGLRVDSSIPALLIRIKGDANQLSQLAKSHLLSLKLKYQHQWYQSHGLEVLKVHFGEDYLLLSVEQPESMSRVYQRASFRVHLPGTLRVRASVRHLGRVLEGQLLDLSYGGCRIVLPVQDSLLLGINSSGLELTLTFPSGDRFTTQIEKVSMVPNAAFCKALLGCRFTYDNEADGQRVMRYTLETEREVARLKKDHSAHLQPSSLYAIKDPLQQLDPSVVQHKKPTMLLQLADQLGAQVLLLQSKHQISGGQLQQVSKQMIRMLEQDRDSVQFSLSREQGFYPLLTHHLRVAAWFYPLALRMGISDQYQMALMSSLLVHDVVRHLVEKHACAPVNLDDRVSRHEFRSALLRVVRAVGELHWIPRSFAEALIVNANELLDGSGFPRKLKGARQDSLTRGLAVVKHLDCLTQHYQGQPRLLWCDAYRWIQKKTAAFDLSMLQNFVRFYGLYPVGSCVHFEKGYVAWVTRVNSRGDPTEVELICNLKAPKEKLTAERVSSQYVKNMGRILGEYAAGQHKPP